MNEYTDWKVRDVKCRCDYDFYDLLNWSIADERTLREVLVDEIWDQYQSEWLNMDPNYPSKTLEDWFEFQDWAIENYETNIEIDGPDVIVSISKKYRSRQ